VPDHDYSPSDALARILTKARDRSPQLAQEIQAAIDLGKDVTVTDSASRRTRIFRQKQTLSDQEAIEAALAVLRAYYLEFPLFVSSASTNFKKAAIGAAVAEGQIRRSTTGGTIFGEGADKELQVAGQTETQRIELESDPLKGELEQLVPPTDQFIEHQRERMNRVANLVRFGD